MSTKILSAFQMLRDFRPSVHGLLLLPLCAALFSGDLRPEPGRFRWPIEKGTFPALGAISSTFGESRTDHFHAGVDIAGDNEPVRPIAGGRLLYYSFNSMNPYRPMAGAGNQLWLDHGDGWWSGYYHLKELRLGQRYVEHASVIAMTGNTGRSGGPHLHFFLTRDYGRIYVNPMTMLPQTKESNPPVIEHLVFITEKGVSKLSASARSKIRLTRPYPVFLELRDPGLESGSRRSPHRVTWKMHNANGKTAEGSILFDTLENAETGLILNRGGDFDMTYTDTFLRLGEPEFSEGENVFEISAEDYAGNTGSATFTIDVKKEY